MVYLGKKIVGYEVWSQNSTLMPSTIRKQSVAQRVRLLPKFDLFLHFIGALRNECYLYASILRDEIRARTFTFQEVRALQNSSFYSMLNGVLDN